jgi:hypothetical protein
MKAVDVDKNNNDEKQPYDVNLVRIDFKRYGYTAFLFYKI